jgi:hypothetical protein
MTNAPGNGHRGDLEIVSETILIAIPRGDEELRVTFTRGRIAQGRDVSWHSLRIFWKTEAGEWRPGKQGITVRGGELRAVADALSKAASGGGATAGETEPPPSPAAADTATDDDIPF